MIGYFRHWKRDRRTAQDIYDYFTDIHPKTEEQYNRQKWLKGFDRTGWYESYMVGKSLDEKSAATRKMYNLGFSDIKYPWLSDVSGGNASSSIGGMSSTVFSANMRGLYYSSRKKKKGKRKRSRRSR